MRGDALAAGARSATFPVGHDAEITIPTKKQLFGECRDCPRKFYSALEFSAHIDRETGGCK